LSKSLNVMTRVASGRSAAAAAARSTAAAMPLKQTALGTKTFWREDQLR
jgi:hypothetical protein